MKLFYAFCFLMLISSCSTRLHYIGNSFPKSQNVDVHVDQSMIDKPYSIIGKGYIRPGAFGINLNRIQPLAVAKAKQKGADAVLIQDDYAIAATSSMRTMLRTDSVGGGRVTLGNTTLQPSTEQNFTVLFLKYKE